MPPNASCVLVVSVARIDPPLCFLFACLARCFMLCAIMRPRRLNPVPHTVDGSQHGSVGCHAFRFHLQTVGPVTTLVGLRAPLLLVSCSIRLATRQAVIRPLRRSEGTACLIRCWLRLASLGSAWLCSLGHTCSPPLCTSSEDVPLDPSWSAAWLHSYNLPGNKSLGLSLLKSSTSSL